jgi:hypothetical protein
MSQIYDAVVSAEQSIDLLLQELKPVSLEEAGLDPRCGWGWILDDAIVVEGGAYRLDYYGGFEYIDDDFVQQIGRFKIYMVDECNCLPVEAHVADPGLDCCRVMEAISHYYSKHKAS